MEKTSIQDFIIKAKIIHCNKYNYSNVIYINNHSKVKILCKEHGIFEQTPKHHTDRKRGCPKCSRDKKSLTQKDFINRCIEIFDIDKYDYKLVNYINSYTKVKILCKEHGIFETTPNSMLNGHGCAKCKFKIFDKDNFILKSNKKHNNKYNYSNIQYVNYISKINVICPIHGDFKVLPKQHLKGSGCPKCAGFYKTSEEFIKQANIKHNNKYDYSKTIYINSYTKVKVICKEHGEFEIVPNNHVNINVSGCKLCSDDKYRHTLEEFILLADKKHHNKYDYSKTVYINSHKKIIILCEKHGEFTQTPGNHLNGDGCPICKESKSEIKIDQYLKENNIKHTRQHIFENCKHKRHLPFDFYLPELNICIEYDGSHHFKNSGSKFYCDDIPIRDDIKTKYCDDNGIKLIRINYKDKIDEKMNFYFNT